MKKYIELAFILLNLEIESIQNDSKDHFAVCDWLDKFGEDSYKLADDLLSEYEPTKEIVLEMAKAIKSDFDTNYWQADKDGSLYNYMMPTVYGDYLNKIIEVQLADLTKVGTQTELILN